MSEKHGANSQKGLEYLRHMERSQMTKVFQKQGASRLENSKGIEYLMNNKTNLQYLPQGANRSKGTFSV